jgi:hypothetical protein
MIVRLRGGKKGKSVMQQNHRLKVSLERNKRPRWKSVLMVGVPALLLVCVCCFLLFADPVLTSVLHDRLARAFSEAYPGHTLRVAGIHTSIWRQRLTCDSIVVEAKDSTFTCSVSALSIHGVHWLQLIGGNGLSSPALADIVIEAGDVVVSFPVSRYALRCGAVRVSIPDSEMVVDTISIHPTVDDPAFFASDRYRQTRYRFATTQCRVSGLACLDALLRDKYRARSLALGDMALDIVVNKDKPSSRDSLPPVMPTDVLLLMQERVRCDTVHIRNAGLQYGELIAPGLHAAVITLDSMLVDMERITTDGGAHDTLLIHARGDFMKSAKTEIVMALPVSSTTFSFRYSGALHFMDLSVLNRFIEPAESQRITAGMLHEATFAINVVDGKAQGAVRAEYTNLFLTVINRRTGSANGFLDRLATFLANTVKLRATNPRGKTEATKIGAVHYTRQRDDRFFQFIWFSIRSGVGDIVGL